MGNAGDSIDPFFTQTKCSRCGGELKVRTMSWFTEETICDSCADKERILRNEMRMKGYEPRDFEGCGKIPDVANMPKVPKKNTSTIQKF